MKPCCRLVVTMQCPRSCPGCCNTTKDFAPTKVINTLDDLKPYQEIVITGGEPSFNTEETFNIIHHLFYGLGGKKKLWYYTAWYNREVLDLIMSTCDGIQFSLHYPASNWDMSTFELATIAMSQHLKEAESKQSFRLAIDNRFQDDLQVLGIIGRANLDIAVKFIQWSTSCPLPANEELATLAEDSPIRLPYNQLME